MVHGLGVEHEMAPAVLTSSGWKLLDVQQFNDVDGDSNEQVISSDSQRVVIDVPSVHKAKRRSPKDRQAHVFHALVRVHMALDQQANRHTCVLEKYNDDISHGDACSEIGRAVAQHARWKGVAQWKGVEAFCIAHLYQADVYVKPSNKVSVGNFEAALVAATAQVSIRDTRHERFEVDSGFIEVKSSRPRNATVASIVKQLHRREAEVVRHSKQLAAAADLRGVVGILPHGQVVSGTATYAGSYHVWVTLPHRDGPAFDHGKFVRDHSRLVSALQWIQPLLLACMPPDPRSPGSGQKYSRASMRSRLNSLSAFGVAHIPEVPETRNVMCYASIKSLNDGARPTVVSTDSVTLKTSKGMKLNLLACHRQDRYGSGGRANWTSGAGFVINRGGTDVRYDTCWSCGPTTDMRRHDTLAFVKTAAGIEAASLDKESGTFKLHGDDIEASPIGIEFRVFDHIPSEHVSDLVSIVALAGASATARERPIKSASTDRHWILQMRDAAAHGSRVPVLPEYWAGVCKAFGVKKGTAPGDAFAGLNALLEIAYAEHGRNAVAKALGLDRAPRFPDVNLPVWVEGTRVLVAQDPSLRLRISRVLGSGVDDVVLAKELGPGWRDDVHMLKAALKDGTSLV